MQKKIRAYINEARIVADCPDCNGSELVRPGEYFLCAHCHPELRGTKTVTVDGYKIPVSDPIAAQSARQQLIESGEAALVIVPDNFERIWEVLRLRPSVLNMNWYCKGNKRMPSGETLDQLIFENIQNGDRVPEWYSLAGGA